MLRNFNRKDMVSLVAYLYSGLARAFSSTPRLLYRDPKASNYHHVLKNVRQLYEKILVIGDVHGCHDEMQELLKIAGNVQDDPKTLKIFVGDLINKGPKNLEVLEVVMQMPSAVSVRGNHDEVVINEIKNLSQDPNHKPRAGSEWMKLIRENGATYLNNLPYTISIPELNCIIVHAGLVPNKELPDQKITDMVSMRNVVEDVEGVTKYQGTNSDKIGIPWASVWKGPMHVYFGHDAKRLIQEYPLATGLDSGCVYGKSLSGIFIYGPRKGEIISVKAKAIYQVPQG